MKHAIQKAGLLLAIAICSLTVYETIWAQSEDEVVINEFAVNPATGKEYVELLVTKPGGVNMQGWTLSDVGTRAGGTGATEGDVTLPPSPFLSCVPQGTYVVIVMAEPETNQNTLTEDLSLDDGNNKLTLVVGSTQGLNTSGTFDVSANDNIQIYAGARAAGALIDQVLCGSNTSIIAGASWGSNINGITNNSAVRFGPTANTTAAFQDNDTGARFTIQTSSYGTPGLINAGLGSDTAVTNPTYQSGSVEAGCFNSLTVAGDVSMAGSVTVYGVLAINTDARLRNHADADLTIGGMVTNDGTVDFNGGGASCGDADSILIRSTVAGVQRPWTGSGSFSLVDVDVSDQAGTANVTALSGTNSGNNGANWTITTDCAPLEASLVSFEAKVYESGEVLLEWKTGYEVDNLGFNVYREEAGTWLRVTEQMIAGSALLIGPRHGLASGQSYAWRDRLARPEKKVVYWLEDVDLDGTRKLHGPAVPAFAPGNPARRPQAALLSRLGQNGASHGRVASSSRVQKTISFVDQFEVGEQLAGKPAVKITIKDEGWYRVGRDELVAAGLASKTDPRMLRMFLEGVEQPMLVTGDGDGSFDQGDSIEFYATGQDNPYTDANTYWLASGERPGKRVGVVRSEGRTGAPLSFPCTVEFEEKLIYFSALRNGEAENFFGRVVASEPVEQRLVLTHLDTAAAASAAVEVRLQGVTDTPGPAPDHQIKIMLNGEEVGRAVFDGRVHHTAALSVPHNLLNDGENIITLTAEAGPADIALVDLIRVTYRHTNHADGDRLKMTIPVGEQPSAVTIEGFSSPRIRVADVTNTDDVQEIVGSTEKRPGGYAVTVDTTGRGQRTLLAFAEHQIKRPEAIAANRPSRWRGKDNGADLVIIAHSGLMHAAATLKAFRESEGLSVAVADIEDVYDELSFGQKTPRAIKDFITFARLNWKTPPRYALLIGDASLDPRNYLGQGNADYVPTKLLDTEFLETSSDDWFGDSDGDGLAEIPIGRLPARTQGEAERMIARIISFERSTVSPSVLLVADENDGYDFEGASERLMRLVPAHLGVEQINRGRADAGKTKTHLLEAIAGGQMLVNYFGHGSVELWRGELLTSADARQLTNEGRPPIFILMTCLNGYFQGAATESLAEALMKAERGGAVAVWSSSGLTGPSGQARMNEEFFRSFFDSGGRLGRLGDVIFAAKAASGGEDARRTWVLLGDPATRLRR